MGNPSDDDFRQTFFNESRWRKDAKGNWNQTFSNVTAPFTVWINQKSPDVFTFVVKGAGRPDHSSGTFSSREDALELAWKYLKDNKWF
jgi:hypothetical protein